MDHPKGRDLRIIDPVRNIAKQMRHFAFGMADAKFYCAEDKNGVTDTRPIHCKRDPLSMDHAMVLQLCGAKRRAVSCNSFALLTARSISLAVRSSASR